MGKLSINLKSGALCSLGDQVDEMHPFSDHQFMSENLSSSL